jgi:PilZ domain
MSQGLGTWLTHFLELHDRERRGQLTAEEGVVYRKGREELAELLVLGQRLELKPGDSVRRAVRVARAMQVEFELDSGKASFLTRDLSVGGLCALVDNAPEVGTILVFHLKLGRDVEPVVGRCRVVHAAPHGGSTRMAVMFEALDEAAQDRIQTIVFDGVCSNIRLQRRG